VKRFPARAALLWSGALVVVTLVMLSVRSSLDKAHVALLLLLVILGGSAVGGRLLGLLLAGASFLLFNWFFVEPYFTLAIANPFDWLVLVAFLVTGIVAAQVFHLAQEEARASRERENERVRNALLASISHDLRTPLTTIKALAHDLSVLGDERSEIIEQEADRLSRTVADLLDLSRLNAGALPLRIELNAVDDLLGALLQRVEGAVAAERLRVTIKPEDQLLVGNFDFVHTLRIAANLVENAAKYAPEGSPIEVTAERRGAELVIRVADRGPGVPASEAERVFDEYYRAGATAPDVAGAGLGLSIARRLAEAQRGSLTYEAREGGGSVFTLRIPAADLNAEAAETADPSAPG
jgi:two-component system, OmpR family, sensor histidine kinase KdpD